MVLVCLVTLITCIFEVRLDLEYDFVSNLAFVFVDFISSGSSGAEVEVLCTALEHFRLELAAGDGCEVHTMVVLMPVSTQDCL